MMVDFDSFTRCDPPVEGTPYGADFGDLSLRPGAPAVDAGVRLPTINDAYTGSAPDLGCFEQGGAPLRYGPREREGDR